MKLSAYQGCTATKRAMKISEIMTKITNVTIPAMNTCILVNVVCLAINSRPTHMDKTKITREPKLEISLANVELPNRPPKIAIKMKTIVYTQVHIILHNLVDTIELS